MAEAQAEDEDHPRKEEIMYTISMAKYLVKSLDKEMHSILQYIEENLGKNFEKYEVLVHKIRMFHLHAEHEIEGFETYDFLDRAEYQETRTRLIKFLMYRRTILFYDVLDKFMDECCTKLYHDYERNVLMKDVSQSDDLQQRKEQLAVDIEEVEDYLEDAMEFKQPTTVADPTVRPGVKKFIAFLLGVHKEVKSFVHKHRVIVIETDLEKFLDQILVPPSYFEHGRSRSPIRRDRSPSPSGRTRSPSPTNVERSASPTLRQGSPRSRRHSGSTVDLNATFEMEEPSTTSAAQLPNADTSLRPSRQTRGASRGAARGAVSRGAARRQSPTRQRVQPPAARTARPVARPAQRGSPGTRDRPSQRGQTRPRGRPSQRGSRKAPEKPAWVSKF